MELFLFAFLATPFSAILTAVAAAALPIAIHLLTRNRYRMVPWGAMRFLLAAHRRHRRRVHLQQLLLLACRLALVILLVAAMASVTPWAQAAWQWLFPDTAGPALPVVRRTHKVLVIDGSFSMAQRVGDLSCFERARATATRLVSESASGDGFSLILMAAPPRRIVSRPSDNPQIMLRELETLTLPHGTADLPATFEMLTQTLRESPDRFTDREVYFITDLQHSTWISPAAKSLAAAVKGIQSAARTTFVDVGQDGLGNIAVTSLSLAIPCATTGSPTPFSATVRNYGLEGARPVRVQILVGRARMRPTDRPFQLALAQEQWVSPAPGLATTVKFSHTFVVPGEYAVQFRIASDALELDNARTLIVSVRDSIPVLLVNGKPAVQPYDRATEWLKDALNPYVAGPAPPGILARPTVISESQFGDVNLETLLGYDCLCLCDLSRVSRAQVAHLKAYLHHGGALIYGLGPDVDLDNYNELLFAQGKGLLPARLLGIQASPEGRAFSFQSDDKSLGRLPLPVFAGDDARVGLMQARFRRYARTQLATRPGIQKLLSFAPLPLTADYPPHSADPRAAADLRDLPSGDAALISMLHAGGRVILFTSTFNLDWNSWPVSPSFLPFVQELLRYAVGEKARGQTVTVGDPLEAYLSSSTSGHDLTVYLPDGRTESFRTQDREDGSVLRWSDTDLSGIYRIAADSGTPDHLFAVNVPVAVEAQDPNESDLHRATSEELHATFSAWDFEITSTPFRSPLAETSHARTEPGMEEISIGADLARWILWGVTMLLMAELVLAWRLGSAVPAPSSPDGPVATATKLSFAILAFIGVLYVAVGLILAHAAWTGDLLAFLPLGWRQAIERFFGVPPALSVEGIRWHIDWIPSLQTKGLDPWLGLVLALVGAAVIALVYRRDAIRCQRSTRRALSWLRIGTFLLCLAVLLPQLRVLFQRQSWPNLVLIVDDSRSMSVAEHYQDPAVEAAVLRFAQGLPSSAPNRLQLAQQLLTGADTGLKAILAHHAFHLHVYHGSDSALPVAELAPGADSTQYVPALRKIRALNPVGDSSRLGSMIHQVIDDFRGSSLAAIVMYTDGQSTDGEDLSRAAQFAAQRGVPLYFVGLGNTQEAREIRLHDLQVEDTVDVNDRLVFEVRVSGRGFPDLAVPVVLRERGTSRVLATQTVHIDPSGKPVKVRLTDRPTEAGEKTYVIEVTGLPNISSADETRIEHRVWVRAEHQVKILYVESSPRYEYRFLKTLLERERTLNASKRPFDLRLLLLDADPDYSRSDRSALIDFPSPAELKQFDVIIIGDINPAHPRLQSHLQRLVEAVRDHGTGLLFIAGDQFTPLADETSPLADLLPVERVHSDTGSRPRLIGYRPQLTDEGQRHAICRLSADEAENSTIWGSLPKMFWWAAGYEAKPAAQVLALHPSLPGGADSGAGECPLIVEEFVGAGRVLFFGMDETWRWRLRDAEPLYNRFWIQTVRFLARNHPGRVALQVDRQAPYRVGESVRVTARFPDNAPAPALDAPVVVHMQRASAPGGDPADEAHLTLTAVEGSRLLYDGALKATSPGRYQFRLSSPRIQGPAPHAECEVLPPPGEMDRVQMNQDELQRAADQTGGRFYTLASVDRLATELPDASSLSLDIPQPPYLLWNEPWMLAFLLLLLGMEWFLRKRCNLL